MTDLPAPSDEARQRDVILAKRQIAIEIAGCVGAILALVGAGMALGWGWPLMGLGAIIFANSSKMLNFNRTKE